MLNVPINNNSLVAFVYILYIHIEKSIVYSSFSISQFLNFYNIRVSSCLQ